MTFSDKRALQVLLVPSPSRQMKQIHVNHLYVRIRFGADELGKLLLPPGLAGGPPMVC